MKAFICRRSSREIKVFFGILWVIALLMAIFPPLYLWSSGQASLFLGMPGAIWYWLIDAVLLLVVMVGLHYTEGVRGELDITADPDSKAGE
jgi:hypothetical protein